MESEVGRTVDFTETAEEGSRESDSAIANICETCSGNSILPSFTSSVGLY